MVDSSRIDSAIDAALQRGLPRVTVLASDSHGPVYRRSAGVRIFDAANSPALAPFDLLSPLQLACVQANENECRDDDVCFLASLSKLVTCIAAMQLVERGLLGWDDDDDEEELLRWLPELGKLKRLDSASDDGVVLVDVARKPSLKMLLSHTAGLTYDWDSEDQQRWREVGGGGVFDTPYDFDPGASFKYGYSVGWLGVLISRVSAQPLESYLQEHVFAPLQIADMSFCALPAARYTNIALRREPPANSTTPQRCYEYEPVEPWRAVSLPSYGYAAHAPWAHERPETYLGGAGLRGSARSYMRILQALLRHGELDGHRILEPRSVERMFTPLLKDEPLRAANAFLRLHTDPFSRNELTGRQEGESSVATRKNWSVAGAYYEQALESGRNEGAMAWMSTNNLFYVLDPRADLCFVIWANTMARGHTPFDANVYTMWREVERALYASV